MILFESILDGIRDIKDHFGRTMLQLVGIILGAGSIVATFSLSVAGKSASMEYYNVSGGIQKIWVCEQADRQGDARREGAGVEGADVPRCRWRSSATRRRSISSRRWRNENMTLRYRDIEKPRSIMGVTPAYSPMNDFHAGAGTLHHRQRSRHRRARRGPRHRARAGVLRQRRSDRQDHDRSTAPATSSSA